MSGKNEDGSYKTARAKEYPESLNLAIAKMMRASIDEAYTETRNRQYGVDEIEALEKHFAPYHITYDSYNEQQQEQSMGADFWGFK